MRTQSEIETVLEKCAEQIGAGTSTARSMTYEEGVDAAIRWMEGTSDDNPMED